MSVCVVGGEIKKKKKLKQGVAKYDLDCKMITFPNLWRIDWRGGAGFENRRKDNIRRHERGSCK